MEILLFISVITTLIQTITGNGADTTSDMNWMQKELYQEQLEEQARQEQLKIIECVGDAHAEILEIGIKSYIPYIPDRNVVCIPNTTNAQFWEDRYEYGCIWSNINMTSKWYKDGVVPNVYKVKDGMVCQHIFADMSSYNQFGFLQKQENWQYKESDCIDLTLDIKGQCYDSYVEEHLPVEKKCSLQFMWWNGTSCEHYKWSGKVYNYTWTINNGSES